MKNRMKGIILAGGSGTRMAPMTLGVSKQLLPVWDKPLIYYPLSTLMLAGIREILIITTPGDQPSFKRVLRNGEHIGCKLTYAVQPKPEGLAQAFLIGREFVGKNPVALALGDNLFFGHNLPHKLRKAAARKKGATVFCHQVQDPERYGVVTFNKIGRALRLEEKPKRPASSYAVTGLYFYDNHVLDIAKQLKPSKRGEFEITDVNNAYLKKKSLYVEKLGRGIAWLDTGTPEALLKASNFIQILEERQGLKVSCPEEIAYKLGYISETGFGKLISSFNGNAYGQYLGRVLRQEE